MVFRESTESAAMERVDTMNVSAEISSLSILFVSDPPSVSVVSSHDASKKAAKAMIAIN